MTSVQDKTETAIKLNLPASMQLTDQMLFDLCQTNQDIRIERTANGALLIMPPTGGKTGHRNFKLIQMFSKLTEANDNWLGFDSSTGFILPNKALRSPDIAFLSKTSWHKLSEAEQERFIPLCPEFVIELRSVTDNIDDLRAKMQEYIDNGALLGWLIDPYNKQVYVYQPDVAEQCLAQPQTISAAPLISDFTLQLDKLW